MFLSVCLDVGLFSNSNVCVTQQASRESKKWAELRENFDENCDGVITRDEVWSPRGALATPDFGLMQYVCRLPCLIPYSVSVSFA